MQSQLIRVVDLEAISEHLFRRRGEPCEEHEYRHDNPDNSEENRKLSESPASTCHHRGDKQGERRHEASDETLHSVGLRVGVEPPPQSQKSKSKARGQRR